MRLQAKISTDVYTDFHLEIMDVQQGERYSIFLYPESNNITELQIFNGGTRPAVDVHGIGYSFTEDGDVFAALGAYMHNYPGDFYKKYVLINSGPIGLLLNREKEVQYSEDTKEKQVGEGIVFIRAVAYNVTYSLKINSVEVATFTTPKADDDNNQISTSIVAEQLASQMEDLSGYTARASQYVISISSTNDTDFSLEIDDGRSGELANAFTDKVDSLDKLPTISPEGYVVEIENDPTTNTDNRWLKFDALGPQSPGVISEGTWQETVKPEIVYKLDPETLPLVIYRAALNVFFVGPADGAERSQTVDGETYEFTFPSWGERTSGDEESTPAPEFIGKKIRDHTLFRSRYIVCAGETIQFSEVDDIFNFHNDTSTQTLLTDPFGLRGSTERSSPIEWMLGVEDSILAFSSTTQYQIRPAESDVLTPISAEIFRLSTLDMNSNVRPKLSGSQILFATEYFGYTHFREFNYYNNSRTTKIGLNLGSSLDVTNYVPKYIEGYITHWDVGQGVDCAAMISPTNSKELFIYKYLWQVSEQGQRKVQQSWSEWKMNQDVRWIKFMDNALYMLITDDDGTYFAIQLNDEVEVRTEPQIHLDRLIQYPAAPFTAPSAQVTGSYDSATDRTTFTIPYNPAEKTVAIVRYNNDDKQGLKLGETTTGSMVCSERGDWTGYNIAFGERYQFEYEFNTGYAPDKNEAQSRIIGQLAGRTQIMRWTVNHVDTGEYKIRVRRLNRSDDTVKSFRARKLAVSNTNLSFSSDWLENGSMDVPVCSKNDQCRISVESDSWLPITVTSASWQGLYSDRQKAI